MAGLARAEHTAQRSSSLLLFAAGALIPLMPWFFTSGVTGVAWSFALTALGALFVGAYVSRSAGMPQWKGALRQFLIVVAAAGVTYGIGKLAGTANRLTTRHEFAAKRRTTPIECSATMPP